MQEKMKPAKNVAAIFTNNITGWKLTWKRVLVFFFMVAWSVSRLFFGCSVRWSVSWCLIAWPVGRLVFGYQWSVVGWCLVA